MVRENIRISENNFTSDGAFFYSILKDAQILQVKVDDGTVAFSYPLDTAPAEDVMELEWDGVYFWSLEMHKTGGEEDGFTIRKWAIDDFVCKQITSFDFVDDATNTYRATSFSVEFYDTSIGLGNDDGSGTGYLGTNIQKEVFLYDTSRIDVGDILYFVKRWSPAHQRIGTANIEQVFVNSVISSTKIQLSANSTGDPHGDGRGWRGKEANPSASDPLCPDEVRWTKFLWVFNSNSPGPTDTAALYKINANNGSVIFTDSGTQYGSIDGSTAYVKYSTDAKTDPEHTESLTFNTAVVNDATAGGIQSYVVFVKSSTALFYNVTTSATDRSLTVDNVLVDTVTIWTVYDMVVVGTEPDVVLLRLQSGTTYKNDGGTLVDENWSAQRNYARTLLRRHVQSIAVTATPSIVPITTGTAAIVAYLRDQYNDALPSSVTVTFSDDDDGGSEASVSPTTPVTDAFGRAYTTFFAGGLEKDVKVTATSTWVDPS